MQTHAEKHREGETKVAGKSNMKLSQMLLVSLFSWLGKQMKLYIRNPFFLNSATQRCIMHIVNWQKDQLKRQFRVLVVSGV